jgi:hypothetical protein
MASLWLLLCVVVSLSCVLAILVFSSKKKTQSGNIVLGISFYLQAVLNGPRDFNHWAGGGAGVDLESLMMHR